MTAIKNVLQEQKKALSDKMRIRGWEPLSEIEKAEWIANESKRDLESLRRYRQEHPIDQNISASKLGLRSADLRLDWGDIKVNLSDGAKAIEPIRSALFKGHGLIYLCGAYGQAKTLLGKVLVACANRSGKNALYANFVEALDHIRQAFDEQEGKTTELVRRLDWWTSRDVLFLDEFDKCSDTSWAQERKFQIVDRCYQRAIREEALTVIASNRTEKELDGYIRSRLEDNRLGPIIFLNGPDARRVMPPGWPN